MGTLVRLGHRACVGTRGAGICGSEEENPQASVCKGVVGWQPPRLGLQLTEAGDPKQEGLAGPGSR